MVWEALGKGNRGLKTDAMNSNSNLHRGMETGSPPVKAISGIVHLVGDVRDPKIVDARNN